MTMTTMKYAIYTLKDTGKVENMIVIVEGAPVTKVLPIFIGADEYTEDANKSLSVVLSLMGRNPVTRQALMHRFSCL
jgi:methanogenic corrinoid protein MtbC1